MMQHARSHILTRLSQPGLYPYFFLTLLFFLVYTPHLAPTPESVKAAILKACPIWYLAFYVYQIKSKKGTAGKEKAEPNGHISSTDNGRGASLRNGTHDCKDEKYEKDGLETHLSHPTESYLTHFFRGLLLSSAGDICLVYKSLFEPGVFFFGLAQFCYMLALKHNYKRSQLAWVALPLGCFLYSVLVPGIGDIIMRVIVLVYNVLIHTMLFFAIASHESQPSPSSLYSMVGAFIFISSDFLIALNMWVIGTPYSKATILLTYYVAQLLLTLGAC